MAVIYHLVVYREEKEEIVLFLSSSCRVCGGSYSSFIAALILSHFHPVFPPISISLAALDQGKMDGEELWIHLDFVLSFPLHDFLQLEFLS